MRRLQPANTARFRAQTFVCEQHRPDFTCSISKGRTRHTAYPSADVMLAAAWNFLTPLLDLQPPCSLAATAEICL